MALSNDYNYDDDIIGESEDDEIDSSSSDSPIISSS